MAFAVGDSVSGVVSGVTDYGAFVRLEDGTSGMIHISKLSRDFVTDIRSVIKLGDPITATVIANNDGRIALSLIGSPEERRTKKQLAPTDFESMLSSFKADSEARLAGITRREKNRRRR